MLNNKLISATIDVISRFPIWEGPFDVDASQVKKDHARIRKTLSDLQEIQEQNKLQENSRKGSPFKPLFQELSTATPHLIVLFPFFLRSGNLNSFLTKYINIEQTISELTTSLTTLLQKAEKTELIDSEGIPNKKVIAKLINRLGAEYNTISKETRSHYARENGQRAGTATPTLTSYLKAHIHLLKTGKHKKDDTRRAQTPAHQTSFLLTDFRDISAQTHEAGDQVLPHFFNHLQLILASELIEKGHINLVLETMLEYGILLPASTKQKQDPLVLNPAHFFTYFLEQSIINVNELIPLTQQSCASHTKTMLVYLVNACAMSIQKSALSEDISKCQSLMTLIDQSIETAIHLGLDTEKELCYLYSFLPITKSIVILDSKPNRSNVDIVKALQWSQGSEKDKISTLSGLLPENKREIDTSFLQMALDAIGPKNMQNLYPELDFLNAIPSKLLFTHYVKHRLDRMKPLLATASPNMPNTQKNTYLANSNAFAQLKDNLDLNLRFLNEDHDHFWVLLNLCSDNCSLDINLNPKLKLMFRNYILKYGFQIDLKTKDYPTFYDIGPSGTASAVIRYNQAISDSSSGIDPQWKDYTDQIAQNLKKDICSSHCDFPRSFQDVSRKAKRTIIVDNTDPAHPTVLFDGRKFHSGDSALDPIANVFKRLYSGNILHLNLRAEIRHAFQSLHNYELKLGFDLMSALIRQPLVITYWENVYVDKLQQKFIEFKEEWGSKFIRIDRDEIKVIKKECNDILSGFLPESMNDFFHGQFNPAQTTDYTDIAQLLRLMDNSTGTMPDLLTEIQPWFNNAFADNKTVLGHYFNAIKQWAIKALLPQTEQSDFTQAWDTLKNEACQSIEPIAPVYIGAMDYTAEGFDLLATGLLQPSDQKDALMKSISHCIFTFFTEPYHIEAGQNQAFSFEDWYGALIEEQIEPEVAVTKLICQALALTNTAAPEFNPSHDMFNLPLMLSSDKIFTTIQCNSDTICVSDHFLYATLPEGMGNSSFEVKFLLDTQCLLNSNGSIDIHIVADHLKMPHVDKSTLPLGSRALFGIQNVEGAQS